MAVLGFIKENRVLVAGLVLPLLLIGVLALAKTLPAKMIDPPANKVAFYTSGWSQKGNLTLTVNATGHLAANFKADKNYKPSSGDQAPKTTLYIYDPKTNIVHDTELTLGTNDALPSLDKFSSLKLSTEKTSSDGYLFEPYHYRNHSLITDIFTYRASDNKPVLSKDGRFISIPMPQQSYGNYEFLGWITEGEAK